MIDSIDQNNFLITVQMWYLIKYNPKKMNTFSFKKTF
jgi:hypothetical protein